MLPNTPSRIFATASKAGADSHGPLLIFGCALFGGYLVFRRADSDRLNRAATGTGRVTGTLVVVADAGVNIVGTAVDVPVAGLSIVGTAVVCSDDDDGSGYKSNVQIR